MSTVAHSRPELQGVDPAAIRGLVEAWEAAGVRPSGLVIARHGHIVARAVWAPYADGDRVQKYSLSKTFTACAVGLAVDEGRLSVDDLLVDLFPQVGEVGPRAATLRVRHLLSMATGHEEDTLPRLDQGDLVGSFLRLEPEAEPGTLFAYNNGATLVLSAVVQQVTGEPLHTYLRPRLLDPLGIGPVEWLTLGGYDQGFAGLHTDVDAIARLGLLLLGRGELDGRRVLPAAWVDAAMSVHVANGTDPATDDVNDWAQGYGYQMWRSRHGWRGDGAYGQLCLVLPEQDLVLAATAQTEAMQAELDAVWEHLLPGLHDDPLPDGEDLTDFLAARTLPVVASSAPATPGRHALTATGSAASLAPLGTVVVRDGTLVAEQLDGSVLVTLGDGAWVRGSTVLPDGTAVEVAGTGGWTAPGVFDALVVPLHSPHTVQVHADLVARTAELSWTTVPLRQLTLRQPSADDVLTH
ncbi:MAG: beta-lactamase family protein [Actinobacteria bacterium]|nr:beta-lactamase family protein [Actinomycetota bacterium]MCG2800946.1 beta-lactamase family protein [Cellulomonas sp.]